ncbi:MAG: hypothetical protein NC900_04105, partial [Candidatus Omnitrophica bacterium]|nr:hypothetical protein [Candidatus Omnitrophota bacterium]
GITEAIKRVISEKGSIIEEPITNTLIITDLPAKFPIIEEIIKKLDVPQPQVMLEVEMLDVSRNLMERLGIKFGDITAYPSIFTVTFSGPSRQTNFPLKSIKSTPSEFTPGTISFAGSYQMLLDFIKSQTDTKILARPRILTINNQPAEIKITADEVVGTKRTRDPNTGEITVEETRASEFDITKEGVGVFLRVTPQVNQETGEITMFVYPKVSGTRQSASFADFRDPEARSTKSLVRIKDGQTIVIAGLIRKETSEVLTKLPLLGDIPLVGSLFRHRAKTKDEDRELLVFITPHILKEKVLAKAVEETKILEREQVSQTEFLRERSISDALNNFEKIK